MARTYGPYQATVVNIHDGDTVDVDIVLIADRHKRKTVDADLGFDIHHVSGVGVKLERQSVRLAGCNAAELSTDAGKEALAYLETILHVGDVVTVVSQGWDKYAPRIDGQITLADGRDLTQAMIAAGQAVPWDGQGQKPAPAS